MKPVKHLNAPCCNLKNISSLNDTVQFSQLSTVMHDAAFPADLSFHFFSRSNVSPSNKMSHIEAVRLYSLHRCVLYFFVKGFIIYDYLKEAINTKK